jgi:hypothetical protein
VTWQQLANVGGADCNARTGAGELTARGDHTARSCLRRYVRTSPRLKGEHTARSARSIRVRGSPRDSR